MARTNSFNSDCSQFFGESSGHFNDSGAYLGGYVPYASYISRYVDWQLGEDPRLIPPLDQGLKPRHTYALLELQTNTTPHHQHD